MTAFNGYLNWYTVGIWRPETLGSKLFGVRISNGQFMCYVLFIRPSIWKPDQYKIKQHSAHLTGIQMIGLARIQMAFKYFTIWHPASFRPFEYQTSLVFRSPLYSGCLLKNLKKGQSSCFHETGDKNDIMSGIKISIIVL